MSDQYDYNPESGAGGDGADDFEYDGADAGFDGYSEYPDGRSDS
ncbi:hypothetical protein [Streptomyces sp. NBC_01320]|nr:hypothetical protein OG395_23995 [Streptomyces sp. NBC_01320]